ncbi:MAG TPA: DUF6152 family protein [Terriglobia bacterium]|nr:DUF6152 family protein [Terriglobia bacterium]
MRLRLTGVIAVLLATVPLWAHHGATGFDQTKPVHLIGKVSILQWNNPHVVIHLDVAGVDGKVATWRVNTLPPNVATRNGFSQSSFPAGTELTVDGYQARWLSSPGRIDSRQPHEHRVQGWKDDHSS